MTRTNAMAIDARMLNLIAEVDEFKGRWDLLGRLTISEAVTLLTLNRNTAKLHLKQLVPQGYLEQHGTGRASWYSPGK